MKKAIDQTIRDLKREVNKKVLKVPGIEQKVLDATSNEPWGPHGSNLADIAHATRNYHEYQLIMSIIWKRINDTGKNWRHVYKALTVLEYLVAHGSERVIDEIREHAYQISTLSDFQYIDSSGRDQGSNVRRKSQSLVALVNDKEKIQEARQKAASNKDKYRNPNSTGGMYRPGSSTGGYGDRYDDDRYGYRDDDRNGHGRERDREWGYRDDDRYGRGGDSYSRDGDRYSRESDDRYGRDGPRDDDSRGRSRTVEDYQYGSRARSSDAYKDRGSDDDGHYSSRSSGARADDQSQGERRLERKFSEQNIGAPPSYEDTVNGGRSPDQNERDGEAAEVSAQKAASPTGSANQDSLAHSPATAAPAAPAANQEHVGFDEFDPRGSVSVSPPTASNGEVDLLGSLTESFSSNSLALMPVTGTSTAAEVDPPVNPASGSTFVALSSASTVLNQPVEDPFGDSPFKATPAPDNAQVQQQYTAPANNFQPSVGNHSPELALQPYHSDAPQQVASEPVSSYQFGDTFPGITYAPSSAYQAQAPPANPQFLTPEPSVVSQDSDILAGILPPSGPAGPVPSQSGFPPAAGYPGPPSNIVPTNMHMQSGVTAPSGFYGAPQPPVMSYMPQQNDALANVLPQTSTTAPAASFPNALPQTGITAPAASLPNTFPQTGTAAPVASFSNTFPQTGVTASAASLPNTFPQAGTMATGASFPNTLPQTGTTTPAASLSNMLPQTGTITRAASLPTPSIGTSTNAQPAKDKFETKSTVWADTLSRGLVNLNISGPKINPLADIGIDFDSINRKEKREKPVPTTTTSTITMGKAMGSGSGIGRAGAGALPPPPNPMMGSGMGMGMGMGMGTGGGMNRPMGMGMGMNMGGVGMNQPPMGMGMGGYGGGMNQHPMGMGMGQGGPQMGPYHHPQGPMPGSYNPMMGAGGYPQQPPPYGGGYQR